MTPVWNLDLDALDFKILWWLLAHQEEKNEIATGIVRGTWKSNIRRDMDIDIESIDPSISRLKKSGVIVHLASGKTIRINGEAFLL